MNYIIDSNHLQISFRVKYPHIGYTDVIKYIYSISKNLSEQI